VADDLTDRQYGELLAFRSALRGFLAWSEAEAKGHGLTPSHHQLLLAIRGWDGDEPPTIGDVAAELRLRHHSAVELVNRAEQRGLVERRHDTHDRRAVRLHLTRKGRSKLRELSIGHVEELRRLSRSLPDLAALDG
jgi:DNA-binding MarR family transcriptional regulator